MLILFDMNPPPLSGLELFQAQLSTTSDNECFPQQQCNKAVTSRLHFFSGWGEGGMLLSQSWALIFLLLLFPSPLQPFGPVAQHVSVQNPSAGLQSSPSPVVTVLQPPPEPPLDVPKLLMPPAEESALNQNQAFVQHLQEVKASGIFWTSS